MKKVLILLLSIFFFATCQKAPEIIVSGEQKVEFDQSTHSFTVTVKSNRAWTATAESWIHVSPSSIQEPTNKEVTVTISIDENRSYDTRTADVTFTAEEAVRSVTVQQEGRHALMLPSESKQISVAAEGKTVDLVVWSNTDYDIVIPSECDWIKLADSKALPEHHHSFVVAENGSRQTRSGKIEFVNKAENFYAVAEIKQEFHQILVSRDTLRASGRGWSAVFETVGADPDEYLISIEDRWLAMDRTEKVDGHSRFYMNAQALEEGAEGRNTRVLVFYKDLAEPDTLIVKQYPRMPFMSYTTTEKTVNVPTMDGDKAIAFVSWGDGYNDIWQTGLTHSYETAGTHTIGVEFAGVKRVHIYNPADGMTINMREVRK